VAHGVPPGHALTRDLIGTPRGVPGLVVFDNDGVLIDSESLANRLLASYLTGLGVPTSFDYSVRHYLGGSLSRVRVDAEQHSGRTLPPSFEADFERRLIYAFEHELRPAPGVPQILRKLRDRRVPFCVASSGSHARIRSSLLAAGLWQDFDGRAFSADDVSEGKPRPELFLLAARTMGVPPQQTLVIEDSPLGIQAGLAAGMTVWAVAGLSPATRAADAHRRFASMLEIEHSLALLTAADPRPPSQGHERG
jgi:HAD superfamily hydrolase (TIGR01509 family)